MVKRVGFSVSPEWLFDKPGRHFGKPGWLFDKPDGISVKEGGISVGYRGFSDNYRGISDGKPCLKIRSPRLSDAIMKNHYASNPGKLAAWLSASRVERDPQKAPPAPPTPDN